MKWAIIGLGFISTRHRQAISDSGGELVVTCDTDPKKSADCGDWRALMASRLWHEVTHVAICTPTHTHEEIARAALATGKQVLCEKPLTIHDDYYGLENVGVVLQLRYNPRVREMKTAGVSHVAIRVKTYREPEYWQSWKGNPLLSGGILYNMGVHYVDLLTHLLGQPLEIISSQLDWKYRATGSVRFERGIGDYDIELTRESCPTIREITADGVSGDIEGATIPLSDASSQTYRNLHSEVYKEFVAGRGLTVLDARPSLRLIQRILEQT